MKTLIKLKVGHSKSPCVGKTSRDPKTGELVYVVDGSDWIDGRLSNFWTWRRVNADGTLAKSQSGYGW